MAAIAARASCSRVGALVVAGAFRRYGRAVLLETGLAVSAFGGASFGARASWRLRPLGR
jgi:hypothetical protein